MQKKNSIFIAFALLLFAAVTMQAQAPQVFNYQAVVRNASGEIAQNRTVNFRLSILDGGTSGTPQYVETQSRTTNQFGLVNFGIGSGTPVQGSMANVTWGGGSKFLKVEMDINALFAANAGGGASGWGLTGNSITGSQFLGTTNAQDLRFQTNGLQRMVLNQNGQLGLGTTNPNYLLHLVTNADGLSSPDGRNLLYLRNNSTASAAAGGLEISTAGSGITRLWHISPSYSLRPEDQDFGTLYTTGRGLSMAAPNGLIKFQTGSDGSLAYERMRITNAGYIGIATSQPQARMHIEENVSGYETVGIPDTRRFVFYRNPNTGNASLVYQTMQAGSSGSNLTLGHHSSTYSLEGGEYADFGQLMSTGAGLILRSPNGIIKFQTSLTQSGGGSIERMRIDVAGNVGIGTQQPKAKLEVTNGDVYVNDATKGVILKSPNGNCWRVTIDNTGNFVRTAITCPN
jgi:hypothetical protein